MNEYLYSQARMESPLRMGRLLRKKAKRRILVSSDEDTGRTDEGRDQGSPKQEATDKKNSSTPSGCVRPRCSGSSSNTAQVKHRKKNKKVKKRREGEGCMQSGTPSHEVLLLAASIKARELESVKSSPTHAIVDAHDPDRQSQSTSHEQPDNKPL